MQPDSSSSSSSSSGDASSEPGLWRTLPPDLVKSIIPRLPIITIIRSYTISKDFHTWLTGHDFLGEYSRVASHPSWLLSSHLPSVLCGYDPCLDTWLEFPRPSLSGASPVASSRGLVCMLSRDSMVVCNLVTGTSVEFPQPPGFNKLFFWVVGMVSSSGHGFNVLVAGCELVSDVSVSYKLTASVFDSRSRSWSRGGRLSLQTRVTRTLEQCSGPGFRTELDHASRLQREASPHR